MRNILSQIWNNIQYKLFPFLEEGQGPLSPQHKKLISILELVKIESYLPCPLGCVGRPRKKRTALARSFIAKIVLKLSFTTQLRDYLLSDKQLRRICGWDNLREIPSESTFSRAFEEFSESNLPEIVHQELIKELYEGSYIGHLTRDSVPIEARERAAKKPKKIKEEPTKNGRPKKGEIRKPKECTRIKKQFSGKMSLKEMIGDLPKRCDIGMKKSPKGFTLTWKGYKLHTAVDDHCIPIAAILSSASMHDSQAAIPLGIKADRVAKNFYDLMDAAYDVEEIHQHSKSLGHVPIIDQHRTRTNSKEVDTEEKARSILGWIPAESIRYKKRAPAERFNAILKENYMGTSVRYRKYVKVTCHVMFSVLVLAADLLLKIGW
jgi:hypothetical protein